MFLLHLFPDNLLYFIIDVTLITGIGLFILSWCCFFIPILIPYKPAITLISMILIIAGMYFRGGYDTEMVWRNRVAEVQKKLDEAEAKSKEVNVQIETKVVEKIKIIKEKVHENKKAIQAHKAEINAECKLPDVARVLYNRSVKNGIPGGTSGTNATGSGSKASATK